jgi:carbonic anhydrase
MSAHCETCRLPELSHRRSFLNASFAMTALALLGTGTFHNVAYAEALTKAKRDKLTPDDVLAMMKSGNKRFYTGKRENHNFLAQQRATAGGQHPAAVLLSCIDSRAPAETIMDLRIGDIFNSRVAAMSKIPTSSAVWNSPANYPGPR